MLRQVLLRDFVSTALLTLTFVMAFSMLSTSGGGSSALAAAVVGAEVTALTFLGAGCANPGIVTATLIVRTRRDGGDVLHRRFWASLVCFYITELVAAQCGALLGYLLLNTPKNRSSFFAPQPVDQSATDSSPFPALVAEIVFTFQLVYVVLFTCFSKRDRSSSRFFGPSVGLATFIGLCLAGPISGAPMNPAIATSLQFTQCFLQVGPSVPHCRPLSFLWLYWVSELGASFLAAACFLLTTRNLDAQRLQPVPLVESTLNPAVVATSSRSLQHAANAKDERTALVPSPAADSAGVWITLFDLE